MISYFSAATVSVSVVAIINNRTNIRGKSLLCQLTGTDAINKLLLSQKYKKISSIFVGYDSNCDF